MSIDLVDDLEAAEDYIGAARRAAFDVIGAWHRTDEDAGTAPAFVPVIGALQGLLSAVTDPFMRPSCDDGCCADTCGGHHPDDPDPMHGSDEPAAPEDGPGDRYLEVIENIVALLSGTEWEASTLEEVADILHRAGFSIEEFDEGGDQS